MKLYLESGYLNIPEIENEADRSGISFIVIIGGRQVGKTYGTLQHLLNTKKNFIFLRRTATEMDFICNDINSPFRPVDENVHCKKEGKYSGGIFNGADERIGSIMALSCIAKIRGFDGSVYSDLVFDEFIPEVHVNKIKDEGDAFLNALITVSGNRELDGKQPLRVWLLANSNNIASPILSALNIQTKIDMMINAGQEYSILKDRGIMILLPNSEEVMKKRRQTALVRAIKAESAFTQMAFDNQFSYNDKTNIKVVNILEYRPLFTIPDLFTFYQHKVDNAFYVSSFKSGTCREFMQTEKDISLLRHTFPDLKAAYIKGKVYFQNLIVKTRFLDILYN